MMLMIGAGKHRRPRRASEVRLSPSGTGIHRPSNTMPEDVDLVDRERVDRQRVGVEHREGGELARFDRAEFVFTTPRIRLDRHCPSAACIDLFFGASDPA